MTFGSNKSSPTNARPAPRVYAASPARTSVTPGRLYMLITADYARRRSPDCSFCRVPLVAPCERPHAGAPNWMVEDAPRNCPTCEAIVAELVARYRETYDVIFPAS